MLAVGFKFPAGRYHATPWGRHVNEAEVEWPPAPWRILRGLIATWHRKADEQLYPQPLLDGLLEKLAEQLPGYQLPPAVKTHSRHYMPQGKLNKGREDTSLVFDAFARIHRDAELVVAWPHTQLTANETALLQSLVRDMGFLGRAESWVEGRVLSNWNGEINCHASDRSVDAETGEAHEPVRLIAPLPADEYAPWRRQTLATHGLDEKRLSAAQKRLRATLPEQLTDAMRLDTGTTQRVGWSNPPGARFVTYQRPYESFTPRPTTRVKRHDRSPPTTARLALSGKPLPRIENAVQIGELVRLAAIKTAQRLGSNIPPVLSGHELSPNNRHGHAFYLPEMNEDGRIEHVLIHAPDRLDQQALRALDHVSRIWQDAGTEWQVLFEHAGDTLDFSNFSYCQRTAVWQSVTPYLHPWFRKKRFTIEDQIQRECQKRGLPEPRLESLHTIPIKSRNRRPAHFHCFRRKRGLTQPDTQGSFWRLTFPEPVTGPVALGFGCHFGLGMFKAVTRPESDAQ